jgi:alpha-beta hydrolase superfamily lysophospholipase
VGDLAQTAAASGATAGRLGGRGGRSFYRLLKRPFFGRFMKPWRWPAGVPEHAYARVQIASRSGAMLHALTRRTPAAPRGVVVLAHPMGLAAKGFWLKFGHADEFAARGFHVLAFDFNGFGESESSNFDYPGDLIAVAQFGRRQWPGLPLVAVGASFGAMRALEAAAQAPELFDAVVAEAAAPSLPDFWKHYPLPYAMLQVSRWVVPAWERNLRPTHLIGKAQNLPPLLLIHSAADRWTPPAFGDRIEAAAKDCGRVERLIVEGAEHTHAFRDARDSYTRKVFSFLESLDKNREP